ncbi:MAG TPA: hypothetical protein IAB56_04175 [Candidatus Scybalousia intestinigallinarum]|nr:hypothetical protein [Candidatus Scybalousia intestinigallinarum]
MKKSGIVGGVVLGLALCGYGAWCAYKKFCPECASDMKKDMKKMSKDVEKSIENMM